MNNAVVVGMVESVARAHREQLAEDAEHARLVRVYVRAANNRRRIRAGEQLGEHFCASSLCGRTHSRRR